MKTSAFFTIICSLLSLLPVRAEIENNIPWGIETVAGMRSAYVYRGFKVAETSLDFQIEGEISLSNHTNFALGAWHLSESSSNFSETGIFLDLSHDLNDRMQIGTSLTHRNFQNSPLESGLDLGVFMRYRIDRHWDVKASAFYDNGNDGFYATTEVQWSKPLSEKAFISIDNGISFVSDYLEKDGLNDFYGRLSLTYTISDTATLTPFIGWSIQLENSSTSDPVFGGIWLEVFF